MNPLETYTSTGNKLLHHPLEVSRFIGSGVATPISISIAPTSKCNLSCSFCSNVNREKHEDLDLIVIQGLIYALLDKGLRTVEWSGGGDPTLYPEIDTAINLTDLWGVKQGFITNGIALKENISQENLDKLSWLRISMNCLDYVESIEIPKIKGVLGFSYVMNEKTDHRVLDRLKRYTKIYKPAYVRIVPNCQTTHDDQEENNRVLSKKVTGWGPPFFYQAKHFSTPERCWWGYFKPFVLHDGWVYRCSSVVLNDDAERKFHEKYRWVKIEDLPGLYDKPAEPAKTGCSNCVFRLQNDLVDMLNVKNEMEDFI